MSEIHSARYAPDRPLLDPAKSSMAEPGAPATPFEANGSDQRDGRAGAIVEKRGVLESTALP
ncbi:hypothetical protein [Streptomyces sp. NPDC055005]